MEQGYDHLGIQANHCDGNEEEVMYHTGWIHGGSIRETDSRSVSIWFWSDEVVAGPGFILRIFVGR